MPAGVRSGAIFWGGRIVTKRKISELMSRSSEKLYALKKLYALNKCREQPRGDLSQLPASEPLPAVKVTQSKAGSDNAGIAA
jgi:hypothetical protein